MNHRKIDMINGPLPSKLLLFTLPIALSSILQQLFNAADTSIVGFFDSADSLAAVGTNGEIIALIVSLSSGLSIGVNVLIARQIGGQSKASLKEMTQSALLLALGIGILGLLVGQWAARPLLLLIKTPALILDSAELYLKLYFISYPFLLLYDFGSSILRAEGDSRYPFVALTISGVINVCLNILFVISLQMGVAGVATATLLSNLLSATLILHRLQKDICFLDSVKNIGIHPSYFKQILKIGVPSAIQGAVFCFANLFVQASVNHFGSSAIAGSAIAMNFEYFAYYVITAFGQTATTFVSQNYAAENKKRCRQILWLCILFSILFSFLIIAPIVSFRNFFAGFFSSQPEVISHAGLRILCILFFEPICGLYEVPAGVLRGTGHSLFPALCTVLGTCILRILWICTVFKHHPGLNVLYMAFPISWIITIIFMFAGILILKPEV